jgi:uncharacterized membrane protein required for colicin V production
MTVLIVCTVILAVSCIFGLVKGFTGKASGILALVLSFVLVQALLPTVTVWLREQTPVYGFIRSKCTDIAEAAIQKSLSGQSSPENGGGLLSALSGGSSDSSSGSSSDSFSVPALIAANDGSGSIDREKVKNLLAQYGYDASLVDGLSDEELSAYVQNFLGSYAGMLGPGLTMSIRLPFPEAELLLESSVFDSGAEASSSSDFLTALSSNMSRVEQTKFIDSLPLPDSMKEQLQAFNNSEGYEKLGAADFSGYIIGYIANLILNLLAFLVTLLVTWLIIRTILQALHLFASLPLIRTVDRLGGLVLGFVEGIVIIWILFLILSFASGTAPGQQLLGEVYASPWLTALYNSNLFLRSGTWAMKAMM